MSIIVALLQCRSSWWANCRPRWKTFSEAKNWLFAHFHFFVIMLFSSLFHFILGIGCLQKNCQVVNGSGSSGTENFENKEGDLKETFLISPLLRKRWWWWWARQGSKGRLFVSPWFPLVRKCILGRTAPPISTEHLLSKNASQSSYQGIFLPRCTGHATDQNAEYIAKDDNLVFLPHNKDMSKETSQELGIVPIVTLYCSRPRSPILSCIEIVWWNVSMFTTVYK